MILNNLMMQIYPTKIQDTKMYTNKRNLHLVQKKIAYLTD
jgi:hypothetical protein